MKDLTQGSISRHVVQMAVPIAIGMLVQTIYFLVDLYFVGKLGKEALAGVNAAGNIAFLVMGLSQILGVGTVALISQAVGRKDRETANQVFNQSILIAAFVGLLVLIGGYLWVDDYLRAISSDAETIKNGIEYLYWFIPNLALQFALVAMASALRGTGIVKPTMVVQLISIIINIILAPILIAGWFTGIPMGVAGAGLASTIAILVAVVVMWNYFHRLERYVSVKKEQLKPDYSIIKRLLAIGFPAGGEFLLMFFFMAVIYGLIQNFGATAQAGFGLGSRIMQAIFVPALALAFALPAVIGQNFGGQEYQRVKQAFYRTLVMVSLLMALLTLFAITQGQWIIGFFTQDKEVLFTAYQFLQIIAFNFIPSGIIFSCSGALQGLGNTWPAFYSMASRLLLFVLPAFWLAQQADYHIEQIWILSVATVAIQSMISLYLVRREFKIKLV